MGKPKVPPFVSVVWKDAWKSVDIEITLKNVQDFHKPALMETRGYLLMHDEVGITLANERCLDKDDEAFRAPSFIPAAMVVSVSRVRLTLVKPKAKPDTSSELSGNGNIEDPGPQPA